MTLLAKATLKLPVFCCSATLIQRRRTAGNCPPLHDHCFMKCIEAKLCLRQFILFLFFSQCTPLHWSAISGHLEVTRILVESKADVAARDRCFSLPPSYHLSLTICLAGMEKLCSITPSNKRKPTLLHTCAASALLNDAPPPRCCKQTSTDRRRRRPKHTSTRPYP
jgi:hypothetical protein